jgi:DNA-binding NarL/FixJ family response regulator
VSDSPPDVRILIADAQTSTRAGIRMALEGHGFTICANATNAQDAIESALREWPDVCLIEASLPGDGIAAAEAISTQAPGAAIVILSGSMSQNELSASVRAGAHGYLAKDMDPARLPVALRRVLDGEGAFPRALMRGLLDEFRAHERGRHARELSQLGVELTLRERQTLELLDTGLRTAEIARRLGVSAVTVRRHVSGLLRKLNVPDRAGALQLLRAARGPAAHRGRSRPRPDE